MTELIIAYINSLIDPLGHFDKVYGLCEIIKNQGTQAPKLYSGSGTYEDISFDEYNGVIYHRLNGEISQSENTQFNSPRQIYDRTYPFKAVAIFPKSILDIDDEYIGEKIAENVVSVITSQRTSALTTSIKATSSVVNLIGISTDRSEIQDSEWAGDIDIDFNYAVIAIDYEVVIMAFKSCFEINSCNGVTIPNFNVATVNDALNPNTPILLKPNSSYTCKTGSCAPATVNVNGDLFDTVASGGTLNVPVVNQDDDPIGEITGGKVVVTGPGIAYNYPLTGETTIYPTASGVEGDDAFIEQNVISPRRTGGQARLRADFFTLLASTPNKWGNTNRFTDTLGGQSYADMILQDHFLGEEIYMGLQSDANWNDAIINSLGTDFPGGTNATAGKTDWFMANYTAYSLLTKVNENFSLGWSPLNITSNVNFWCSTTYRADSNRAYSINNNTGRILFDNKSNSNYYIFCRLIDL